MNTSEEVIKVVLAESPGTPTGTRSRQSSAMLFERKVSNNEATQSLIDTTVTNAVLKQLKDKNFGKFKGQAISGELYENEGRVLDTIVKTIGKRPGLLKTIGRVASCGCWCKNEYSTVRASMNSDALKTQTIVQIESLIHEADEPYYTLDSDSDGEEVVTIGNETNYDDSKEKKE